MRYTKTENTILAGQLPTLGTVTIKIINMDTDSLLTLTSDICVESSSIPGVYLFDTSNITDTITTYTNCLYQMTDGTKVFSGKFVIAGYPDDIQDKLNTPLDSNIVSVNSVGVTSIDDFKTDITGIPLSVWSYVDRTLTQDVSVSELEFHNYLDSYINKDNWKADLTLLPNDIWNYTTRTLTQDVSIDETEFHNFLDSYLNKNDWKADLTSIDLSTIPGDVWAYTTRELTDKSSDIISVNGAPVLLSDFKTDITGIPLDVWGYTSRTLTEDVGINENIFHNYLDTYINKNDWKADISNIPLNVWSYVSRELTVAAGLTPDQEQKLNDILLALSSTLDSNIVSVNSVDVTSIDDFKTDISNIPTEVWNNTIRSLTSPVELETLEKTHLMELTNYDDTNLINNIQNLPTLNEIENSTILAKKVDINLIESVLSTLPLIEDFKNEMINIQYGALEITNNQMIVKDRNNEIIAIFNLYDNHGNPTMGAVYKRIVV